MKSSEYLKKVDFIEYLKIYRRLILDTTLIKDYIVEKGDANLRSFSERFFEDMRYGVKKLKEELEIPSNIAYTDILHLYPSDKYIEFLKDIYLNKLSNEQISIKYSLPKSKINELMLKPIKTTEEKYCPFCLVNEFEVDFSKETVLYKCCDCNTLFSEKKLLSESEKEKIELNNQLRHKKRKNEFKSKIKCIEESIEQIMCPKCQKAITLFCNDINFTYEIRCSICNYKSNDYSNTLRDYQLWERRTAMMIAIREKEEEAISKTLRVKEVQKLNFISEKIISTAYMLSVIEQQLDNNIWNKDEMLNFEQLKQVLKCCNRIEKNLLIEIIKLAIDIGKSVQIGGNVFIQIMYERPLVSEIIKITSIIPVRKIMKMLMEKHLVYLTEEDNYILIPSYIVHKLNYIENTNKNQNIEPNLRYITMSRQNFTCFSCGETGRRLKIAYLTTNKKTMNLDELIALCDDCFELETNNEVIIDGVISFELPKIEEPKSIQFLLKYMPDLNNDSKVYDAIVELEDKYGWDKTIKALSIAINKIENKAMDTTEGFLAYIRAVLNNAELRNDEIVVYRNIYTKYKLDEWKIGLSSIK